VYLKIHYSGSNVVVAICDKDILGKTLVEGNMRVTIHEGFYCGEVVDAESVEKALITATTANLFGEKCVKCAIDCGMVNPLSVIYIDGVPHAQIFRIR